MVLLHVPQTWVCSHSSITGADPRGCPAHCPPCPDPLHGRPRRAGASGRDHGRHRGVGDRAPGVVGGDRGRGPAWLQAKGPTPPRHPNSVLFYLNTCAERELAHPFECTHSQRAASTTVKSRALFSAQKAALHPPALGPPPGRGPPHQAPTQPHAGQAAPSPGWGGGRESVR